jgi:hypothetical protein
VGKDDRKLLGHTSKKNVSISTSPVIVYKAPFTISGHAFHMEELSNLVRDDVSRLWKTLPLGSFLVGWLVGQDIWTIAKSLMKKRVQPLFTVFQALSIIQ